MRMRRAGLSAFAMGLLAAACMTSPVEAQFPEDKGPDEWRSNLSTYLWLTALKGENTVGTMVIPIDMGPSDIFGSLKFAGSVHYELGKNQWGAILDFVYVKLGEDTIPVSEPAGVTASYGQEIFATELSGTYRLGPELGPQRFEVLLGARWNRQTLDVVIEGGPAPLPTGGGFKENWVDPILGGRWTLEFGNDRRWHTGIRADVGGVIFGSDFAFNSLVGLGYRFNHWFAVDSAFRYLYTDYNSGTEGTADYFAYKADQYGLILGLTFTF